MKIKTISRTVSFGNYENISMSADIEEGESVEVCLAKLEHAIQCELDRKNSYTTVFNNVQSLEHQKRSLESDFDALKSKIFILKEFLKSHGVDVDKFEQLPF